MTNKFGKLILIVSGQPEQEFTLTQAETTIGSADTNDIVIKKAKVSRAHARIECADTGCTIFDLDSAKGVQVNNQQVKQVNLTSGDVIKLGESELHFETLTTPVVSDATVLDGAIFAEEISDPETTSDPTSEEAVNALVKIQPGGSKSPFFCAVARYSDVSLFGNLAQHLGEDQPFYALQPPQSDADTSPAANIEALVAHYIEQIQSVQAQGPYTLGGFSIGGLIALEMAQQLQTSGHEVSLVALIDTPYLVKNPLPYWGYRSAQTVNQMGETLLQPLQETISNSTFGQRLQQARQTVRDTLQSRVPQIVERMEEDYQVYQESMGDQGYEAVLNVIQSYKPTTYSGKMALSLASKSPVRYSGALWFWHSIVPNGLDVYTVPGSYIGILKEPGVATLANQLKAHL